MSLFWLQLSCDSRSLSDNSFESTRISLNFSDENLFVVVTCWEFSTWHTWTFCIYLVLTSDVSSHVAYCRSFFWCMSWLCFYVLLIALFFINWAVIKLLFFITKKHRNWRVFLAAMHWWFDKQINKNILFKCEIRKYHEKKCVKF